jgi:dipeptidyl aminopeptidase/acylaminoacyl peptidase
MRHRAAVGMALAITTVGTSTAFAVRPMTLDDLLTAVRVTDPQLSADGKLVAFVKTVTDPVTLGRNADIWVLPADGSAPPRPLTRNEKSDTAPRFSPDGRTLAFLSTRSGSAQVHVLDLAGGEARKVTDVPGGVQTPLVVSPDGKSIAFVADVDPSCADEACNRKKADEAAKNPVKAWNATRLPFRHWDEWRPSVRHHVLVADLTTGKTTDATPGDFDSPPHFYEEGGIAFSPDGKTMAIVSNRDGADKEAWSTNKDVFLVPAAGGKAERLTENPAADDQPVFTPDGKSVVIRSQRRAGFEADRYWLEVWDVAAKTKRTVFTEPDLTVEDFVISADGRTVFFTAVKEARQNVYAVPIAGGTPRLLAEGGFYSNLKAGPGFVLASRASLVSPPDVWVVPADGRSARQLTDENASWLKAAAPNVPESFVVKGAGGTPVQSWMVKPPGFDPAKKYPVVFLIHGGPQGAWEDGWSYRWCPSLWAAQGWVVVLPNPRGSSGFGQTFVDEVSGDWCGKVMADLFAVFDDVAKRPFVDPKRQGIAGASYGGYAVNFLLTQTDRFAAAFTHDGNFNLDTMAYATEELWFTDWDLGGLPWTAGFKAHSARCSPHMFAEKIVTPTFVVTNELDYRVPVDQGLQLFTLLRRRGIPSEMLVFPDEGHWVLKPWNSKLWHEKALGWMRKYLGP